MNAAVLPATSALFGSLIGAMTSLASSCLTQHGQLSTKREALHSEFIGEACRAELGILRG
jgi:hypothetical protein